MSALYGAIIDRLEFGENPATLKRDSTGTLPGLMPVYILAIFSLKPIRLKPARLKLLTAGYGLASPWRLIAAYGGGFGVYCRHKKKRSWIDGTPINE